MNHTDRESDDYGDVSLKKRAMNSSCKNPQDRSDKACACGGHQGKRGRKKRKARQE